MKREFIILPEFDREWRRLNLTEEDLKELEEFLCKHPSAGTVITGTGGIRKLRWNRRGSGKRSGI